jgi:hypothetical protein
MPVTILLMKEPDCKVKKDGAGAHPHEGLRVLARIIAQRLVTVSNNEGPMTGEPLHPPDAGTSQEVEQGPLEFTPEQ